MIIPRSPAELTNKEKEILEQIKNEFEDHIYKKYPHMKLCTSDETPEELMEIIPESYLKELIKHFWMFYEMMKEKPKNPKRDLGKYSMIPKEIPRDELAKDVDNIIVPAFTRALTKLFDKWKFNERTKEGKKGWFDEDLNSVKERFVEQIKRELNDLLLNSEKARKYYLESLKWELRNPEGGRWPDHEVNFLIYHLCKYTEKKTGKQRYVLIGNFIRELARQHDEFYKKYLERKKENYDPPFGEEEVRKRFERTNPYELYKLKVFYNWLVKDFEHEWFEKKLEEIKEQTDRQFEEAAKKKDWQERDRLDKKMEVLRKLDPDTIRNYCIMTFECFDPDESKREKALKRNNFDTFIGSPPYELV